ncbi:MAG: protein-disulfide reductase DsbD [Steroidobacteraceae bacterium]
MPRPARPTAPVLLLALFAGLALFAAPWITAQAADAAQITGLGLSTPKDDFVDVDVAFKVSAEATAADRIEVDFVVLKGYYLYRNKMKFAVDAGQPAALGAPDLPTGETKEDEYFGKQEVYHHDVVARIPVSRSSKDAFTLPLKVTYQGCAEAGLCYAPQTKTFQVALPAANAISALPAAASSVSAGGSGYVSEQDRLATLIRSGNVFLMVGAFFLAGLLLSFTPCVLPMVPIVAGLITASGTSVTRTRAFLLSLAYVLGMAATYTAAGVAVAAAGQQAQTLFQQTWIILLFAALFVAMAASMFGFFTVQMPSFIQTRLSEMSNQQKSGSYAGVAVMGALSALIVTTCVGPALVAALSVIGQSGQMVRGGVALFSMAMGMGVPLLVVGASAGQLLPRAGAWMDTVKQVFGALMLAVAVWMVSRVVPERFALLLWMLPLLAVAIVLEMAQLKSAAGRGITRVLATIAVVYAVLLGVGFTQGATDPLQPLQAKAEEHVQLPFQRIKSLDDLNAQVAAANTAGKTVMLDFYADWCVSCKEMEKYTFPTAEVRNALANTVWLQADVTANDEVDKALQKHFGIVGPPSIMFYGRDGVERRDFRVVGFMKPVEFAPLVARALQ